MAQQVTLKWREILIILDDCDTHAMDNCLCSKILSVYNDAKDTCSPAFFEQEFINSSSGVQGN